MVVVPTALMICALMLGALAVHLKVCDPVQKWLLALLVPAVSLAIALCTIYR